VLEDALEHLVRGIVDHPDDVTVDLHDRRQGQVLEVRVHPDDLGKVIGRAGRTAKALRTVMGALGGRGVRVDLVDVDRVR
jgi:predicted RNA-binding protein YlqC (UPF0109 family)